MKKFILYFCLTASALCGEIKEITRIDNILEEITPATLVLFDIDDTLIQPTHYVTHRKWKTWVRKRLAVLYPEDKIKQTDMYGTTFLAINLQAPLTLVEVQTPALIAQLQGRGLEVWALTSRGQDYWYSYPVKGMSHKTIAQLQHVGIHFDKSTRKHDFAACPNFEGGILFTKNEDKGPFLIRLFKQIGYRPEKVVFVDDHPDQVESVVESLEKEGIACVGYHYSAASDKPFHFEACLMQFKYMYENHVLLSNEEVLQKDLTTVSAEDYFLDYVTNYHEKLHQATLSGAFCR